MKRAAKRFFGLSEVQRRDIFEAAASRIDTMPSHVEKDFWVCLVLDLLFNWRTNNHPRIVLKGGTSLSKGFKLIKRFSEDIDIAVFRDGLGFHGERDPTSRDEMSKKRRKRLFRDLQNQCKAYVLGTLRAQLTARLDELTNGCTVSPDYTAEEPPTLLIEYDSLFPTRHDAYVNPRVKIEAGARSALEPSQNCSLAPYVSDELPDQSYEVCNIGVIVPQRTYLEKLLILHGAYSGFRDEKRLPVDRNRISRHYFDVAVMTTHETGQSALRDYELLAEVRRHNLVAFRQRWKRFEDTVPGKLRIVPYGSLRTAIQKDYAAMEGMILGDAPEFEWMIGQLECAEDTINRTL